MNWLFEKYSKNIIEVYGKETEWFENLAIILMLQPLFGCTDTLNWNDWICFEFSFSNKYKWKAIN